VEDKIIEALEGITKLRIFPATKKLVIMEFESDICDRCKFKISKEQFMKFREWLISQGLIETEINISDTSKEFLKRLLNLLGYTVTVDNRRRGLYYLNDDGTKAVFVIYALDDVVTIYRITYFEKS